MSKKLNIIALLSTVILAILLSILYRRGYVQSASITRASPTIMIVGDVMLARSVNANIIKYHNPLWPFIHVQDKLQTAGITIGNLETPLISNCPTTLSGMIFCGQKQNAQGLKEAGFDYLSLANNHSRNYGNTGLLQTSNSLKENGITPLELDTPVYRDFNGFRLALLSFDDVSSRIEPGKLTSQIKNAKESSDFVIVYYHWGAEYQTTSGIRQKELAHTSIDAGADFVVGTHPHVVEEHEIYKGKYIYYSLGNFVFDQEWSAATKKGLALRLSFNGSNLDKVEELPVKLANYGQAFWE